MASRLIVPSSCNINYRFLRCCSLMQVLSLPANVFTGIEVVDFIVIAEEKATFLWDRGSNNVVSTAPHSMHTDTFSDISR